MNLKKNLEEKQNYGENSFSFVNQSLLQPFLYAGVILSKGWTKYNQKQEACLSLYGGHDLKTKEILRNNTEHRAHLLPMHLLSRIIAGVSL